MTRQEAIRIIETVFQDEYVYKYYDSITHQALEVAIEALSAEADISEYADRLWKIAYERGKAESEAKTGEWVEHIGGISHELYYFCDQCYGEVDTNDYNFCPNCGARMKGGDTE